MLDKVRVHIIAGTFIYKKYNIKEILKTISK